MNISEHCIKRPIFAAVLSLILIVVGIMGFSYLHTRFLPRFEQKSIHITTRYPGASAKLVESSVTTPLEKAISGIEGLDVTESTSLQGTSRIKVKLKYGFNVYEVSNKIRNQVAITQSDLPDNIKAPVVKAGWGESELIDIGFTAQHKNLHALRDYLDQYVINKIEQTTGVANVQISGANQYAMRIWLNPRKMVARNITVEDIANAVQGSNVQLPAGEIKGRAMNYPITAKTRLSNAKQFGDIIIKKVGDNIIRLHDIARVKLGTDQNDQTWSYINGHKGVVLQVYNTTSANPIATSERVLKLLLQLKPQLPLGVKYAVAFDLARFMKASVHEVYETVIIAILCVTLVIFLFLGSLRTVIIPIATIPICLLATFGLMNALGFSINMITLLAVVLSIGLVVDDAIVMLENIYRHIEQGMKPIAAAIKGSKEITFAVVAMTITLAAVYAPIGLMKNRFAHIYASFAFTLAGAVIISGFVALTLTPMMCSKLLSENSHSNRYSQWLDGVFERINHGYERVLHTILNIRAVIVLLALLIAVGGYFLLESMPKGFMPHEDMGLVISILHVSPGTPIKHNQQQLNKIYSLVKKNPNVETTVSFAEESSQGFNALLLTLKPFDQRNQSAKQIALGLNKKIHQVPGLYANAFAPSPLSGRQNALEFYILSSGTYHDIYHASQDLIKKLDQYPGLKSAISNVSFNSQQYFLTVNRDLANRLGVTAKEIDTTLANLLGGTDISTFEHNGQNYNVYIQAEQKYLTSLDSINEFYVKNLDGQLIPLGNLVNIKSVLAQQILPHYNRLRSAAIYAQLAPGYSLATVVNYLQQHLTTMLPSNVKYAWTGGAKRIIESKSGMALIFTMALVFIYLVLAAQFESFLDPLVILLVVPLSVVSALIALKLVHGSINIYTTIGLVTLIGLISKHGILITQFANQLRDNGMDAIDALVKAATIRLRPIFMTTAAMVFGALPLALAAGASAISRKEIGIVIVSGLFFGTFFSLIIIPVAYSYATQLRNWGKRSSVAE